MAERRYLSCAETAKLVRAALKESFPGVKFSVRSDSYAGGASIDVRWVDGPTGKQVDEILGAFEGAYFDGMIDYKGSRYHKLDGKPVHFGANFINGSRKESPALIAKAIQYLKAKYPSQIGEEATPEAYEAGKLSRVFPCGGEWSWENSLQQMIRKAAVKRSAFAAPMKSATLARVSFEGDDGYGRGTVGPDGKGGESCYKAENEIRERAAKERADAAAHDALIAKVAIAVVTGQVQPGSEVLQ
jgi:hypothetical protein